MPAVPLDGLVVEKNHSLALDEATRRIELAIDDLAKGSLAAQTPRVTRVGPQELLLAGGKGGSSFEAKVSIAADKVTVALKGQLDLSTVQVMFAGGAPGVRKRVVSEVEQALRDRLAAA